MAIRIPEGPTVETTGLRTVGPQLIDVPDIGGAVAQAGAMGGRALADVGAAMKKAEAEADTLRITQSLTEFERRTTNTLQGETLGAIDAAFEGTQRRAGYLETRGMKAGETSQETLDALQTHLDELGAQLLPRQREAFYRRAEALREDARRRVEGHVATEFQRAKGEGLQAAKLETLRIIGADPRTPALGLRTSLVDGAIDGLATSPEDAAAEKAAFRGDVALVRIQALVGEGDVDEAEEVATEAKDWLGTRNDDVQALLRRARAGDDKKKLQVAARVEVSKWLKEVTPPGGYANQAKLDEMMKQFNPKDPRYDDVEEHLRRVQAIEKHRFEADRSTHRNLAEKADVDGGPIPPASFAWLHEFDNEFLKGWRNERETRAKRLRADADGTKAEKAAAARQQVLDDRFLADKFAALSPEEQAKTTPEEFAKVLAAEFPDLSPSRNGYAATEKHRAETVQRLGKGDLAQEERFRTDLEKSLPGVLLEPKGPNKGKPRADVKAALEAQGKGDRDPVAEAVGNSLQEYRKRRAEKGRDLTSIEESQLLGEMKANIFEITTKGFIFDSKKRVPGALRPVEPLPAKPAPEKVQPPTSGEPVMMTFPNGKTYPVEPSKMDAAIRRGAKPSK